MPLSERNVDDRGRARELGGTREHAADPEIFFVRPAEDDARPHPLGKDCAGQELAHLGLDVELALRRAVSVGSRSNSRSGRPCGISDSVAEPRPVGRRGVSPPAPSGSAPAEAAAGQRQAEDWRLVEVESDGVVIAVSDGAALVLDARPKDGATGLKLSRLGDRDVLDHAQRPRADWRSR